MSTKAISLKCPECGATLTVEDGRKRIFCSYCGTQLIVTNDNEHIYRHIDEARIKEAEANREVELKRLEIIEKDRASAEKSKKKSEIVLTIKIIVSIVLGITGIVFIASDSDSGLIIGAFLFMALLYVWILSNLSNEKKDDVNLDGNIRVPDSVKNYVGKSYTAAKMILENAGFTNIKCIALNDLRTNWFSKPDSVASIEINGKSISSCDKKCAPDAAIVISYHSYSNK